MELFKSGLKSVLGTPQEGTQPSGAETVERLVDRVQSSTLLDDRRDACRALKAMSKKYRVEVGAQGMDALRQVLEMDHGDSEIVSYCLDTLCNITSPEIFEEEDNGDSNSSTTSNIGEQFTEIFIKHPDNVSLVLGFMEEYDFRVRWPAVKLLTCLLANKPKEIQDIILVSPMGVSKLMDLLADTREVIRNDALLLLIQLTKGNANIQKIVAFENAFDRLFDVIIEEGSADGGIVVEDCLLLMLNLLRNNTSNQNFFKEGSYIQRLSPMFTVPTDTEEVGWSAQKVSNIHCMLQVVRTLVAPGNPAQVTSSSQRLMSSSGLLEELCNILMASGVPADILTETINTVAEVIRGNQSNQEYFSNVLAPSNPPRPALVVLLMSMVNEKQPFILRCSVLYCFQCFLFKNEVGQAQLIQTLLPANVEVASLTTGHLLCGGLFNGDPLSNWFSAVALSHALVENPAQKEHLLRVLLSTNADSQPVPLIQQCTLLLQQGSKMQTKLGILMLLSTWLSHCPLSVQQFLNVPSSIPYLTAQVVSNDHYDEELAQGLCAFLIGICILFNNDGVSAFSKENLKQLVEKRIGLEMFLDKLGEVSKNEFYNKAAKHPQVRATQPNELLLDHEFCRLFKALEGMIIKAVMPKPQNDLLNGSGDLTGSESSLLLQYKELIRSQDKNMQAMSDTIAKLQKEKSDIEKEYEELKSASSSLRDENKLLRAASMGMTGVGDSEGSALLMKELRDTKEELDRWRQAYEEQSSTLSVLQKELLYLKDRQLPEDNVAPETGNGNDVMQRLSESQNTENIQVNQLRLELVSTQKQLTIAEDRLRELSSVQEELDKMKKDQEDLLELLTDQDIKLHSYKERLKELGEKIDEDDSEGEDVDINLDGEEDVEDDDVVIVRETDTADGGSPYKKFVM